MILRLIERAKVSVSVRPPDDGRRRAAVAAVLHDEPAGPRVLLMKRSARPGDPWSSHISLPGGGFDARDADLLAAAIRETQEELAIDLTGARLLGNLMTLSPLSAGPSGMEVTPFIFLVRSAIEPRPGPEAEAAFWLPLQLAAAGTFDGTYTYPGTERTFPSWNFEGHVIWGLTWRILGDLLALMR
ncbi:MAG: hydrolase [Myxococcales bacterium]|nr:hydrolase [Myxococcales bacterium]